MAAALSVVPSGAQAGPIYLLRDIYPGNPSSLSSHAQSIVGGGASARSLLWADDGINARQPWVSNGKVSGTNLVGVVLGATGTAPFEQISLGDYAVFPANDGITGQEIWGSDGTFAATQRLVDFTPGSGSSDLRGYAKYLGFAVYSAGQGGPRQLWRSDGTPAGTFRALPTTTISGDAGVGELNGILLVRCQRTSPLISVSLCATDLSEAGTIALTPSLNLVNYLVAVNDRAFFDKSDATAGRELWITDGTIAGTKIVTDIVAGSGDSAPKYLTRVDDKVFFLATTIAAGEELWVSDGTTTQMVKDIRPGVTGAGILAPMVALDGVLYFVANDGTNGNELWRSDGTNLGTQMVADLTPGASGSFSFSTLSVINKRLYFVANGKLWISDGTGPNTAMVDTAGPTVSQQGTLNPVNGKLVFNAATASLGTEPYAVNLLRTRGPVWCSAPERSITDNNATGISDKIRLPAFGGLTDLNVGIDIGHTWIGDLIVKLRHEETATEVIILDRPGITGVGVGCSGDLIDIVLDDQAPSAAETGCTNARPAYPRDTSYIPNNPLAAFNGENLAGTWTLTVSDNGAQDRGTLHEWCLYASTDEIFADDLD